MEKLAMASMRPRFYHIYLLLFWTWKCKAGVWVYVAAATNYPLFVINSLPTTLTWPIALCWRACISFINTINAHLPLWRYHVVCTLSTQLFWLSAKTGYFEVGYHGYASTPELFSGSLGLAHWLISYFVYIIFSWQTSANATALCKLASS